MRRSKIKPLYFQHPYFKTTQKSKKKPPYTKIWRVFGGYAYQGVLEQQSSCSTINYLEILSNSAPSCLFNPINKPLKRLRKMREYFRFLKTNFKDEKQMALFWLTRAYEKISQKCPNSYHMAYLEVMIANQYKNLSQQANTIEWANKAICTLDGLSLNDTFVYADALDLLADYHLAKSEYEKSKEYIHKAFDIRDNLLPLPSYELAKSYMLLAELNFLQSEKEDGEKFLQEAIRQVEDSKEPFNHEYAEVMVYVYLSAVDHYLASEKFEYSFQLVDRCEKLLKQRDYNSCVMRLKLFCKKSKILTGLDELDKAMNTLEEAQKCCKENIGVETISYAKILFNIALLLRQQSKDYEKSNELLEESCRINANIYESEYCQPNLIAKFTICFNYLQLGNYEEGLKLGKIALKKIKQLYSEENPIYLNAESQFQKISDICASFGKS